MAGTPSAARMATHMPVHDDSRDRITSYSVRQAAFEEGCSNTCKVPSGPIRVCTRGPEMTDQSIEEGTV